MAKKAPVSKELTVVQLPMLLAKRIFIVLARVAGLEIKSQTDRVSMSNFLADLVETKDQLIAIYEPEYRARKAPFDAIAKERTAKLKILESAEEAARRKLATWERSERDRLEEVRSAQVRIEQLRLAREIKRETGKAVEPTDLVVQVVAPSAPPPIEGQTYVANWQGECLNLVTLIREAAADPSLVQFLSLNKQAVVSFAKTHKEAAQPLVRSLALRFFDAGSIRVAKGS